MRKALDEDMLELVSGGTVYMSEKKMAVAFTALDEKYELNCAYVDATTLAERLLAENPGIGDLAYDKLVKQELQSRRWLK